MVKEFLNSKKIFIMILISIIILVGCIYFLFSSMWRLPEGEYLTSVNSPNGKYKINAFVSIKSLSDDAVRCELEDMNSGKKRNIYWEYRKSNAEIEWLSNTVVKINGRVLNIETDKYDWRKDDSFVYSSE